MPERDIVSDIITRLAESLGADVVPPEIMMRLEVEIRRDWAGDIYVRAQDRQTRNANLLADYRTGMDTMKLSMKYCITERHVRRIINTRRNR